MFKSAIQIINFYHFRIIKFNLNLFFKDASGAPSPTRAAAKQRALQKAKLQKQKLVSHSTAMESIQAQTEPIDEQEHLP